VFNNSAHKGNALVVLLAIADYADDEGTAFPSIGSLAQKARCSEATVHRILRALQASGELVIETGAGRFGSNLFRLVNAAGRQLTLLRGNDTGVKLRGVSPVTPKPSYPVPTHLENVGTDGSGVTADRGLNLTPPQEAKVMAKEAKALWIGERERHRRRSGEAFARFTDRVALNNLVIALARAVRIATWADIQVALRQHATEPDANPWYLDQWAREAAGRRAEAESLERKMRERAKDDDELRRHYGRTAPHAITGTLAKVIAEAK
jgi:hypothetical protein